MSLEQQMVTELLRRAHLLQQEVAVWDRLTESSTSGLGIHRSQIDAVRLLFEELRIKEQAALDAVVAAQGTADFAGRRIALEQELTATHGVMAVFRIILAQRADKRFFRQALDTADLVAADCYNGCVQRAVGWGVIAADQLRVPPLTYLNSMFSPAAITRTGTFGAFKMPVDGNLKLKLPVGVVSLPFHHTEAVWTFCSLHHEVGHLLDTDFTLRESLRPLLEQRLAGSARKQYWADRLREMVADTFGVLLGGEGFVRMMLKLLFLPADRVTTIDPTDVHPNHYMRILLLAALLRGTGSAALGAAAASIEDAWRGLYGRPAELQPYVDDCAAIADTLLHQPLPALGAKTLADWAPEAALADDQARIDKLAKHLRLNTRRPEIDPLAPFPVRLVPAAAQMAVGAVTDKHAEKYALIHERAFGFVDALRAVLPDFLGPADMSASRRANLRGLVQALDFSALDEEMA